MFDHGTAPVTSEPMGLIGDVFVFPAINRDWVFP